MNDDSLKPRKSPQGSKVLFMPKTDQYPKAQTTDAKSVSSCTSLPVLPERKRAGIERAIRKKNQHYRVICAQYGVRVATLIDIAADALNRNFPEAA